MEPMLQIWVLIAAAKSIAILSSRSQVSNRVTCTERKVDVMIHTVLTTDWGLRYPIIGAPMAGVAEAPLAASITGAGGLGMIGIGSTASTDFLERQVDQMQNARPYGLGLMVWALKKHPELLDAALAAKPTLISLSFGDPAPYIARCHRSSIRVAVQVHDRQEARQAREAGADILVAQGSEAGGHTGSVATLPLLQIVLQEAFDLPVLAAGGIATPMGVAGVLAMGAAGAWIGTAFTVCGEARTRAAGRHRLIEVTETDTILTHVFDRIQDLDWPYEFPGRAIRNNFTAKWHGQETIMTNTPEASEEFAAHRGDYSVDYLYAGQAVGLVDRLRSAADLVQWLGQGAEDYLHQRIDMLVGHRA